MTRTLTLVLTCCALGATTAGCGSSSSAKDTGTTPPAPAQTTGDAPSSAKADATVTMNRLSFRPNNITVTKGALIRWVNEDTVEHDVVAQDGATFKSDLFDNGGTFETKIDNTGTVTYVCTIHPNMTGKITVK